MTTRTYELTPEAAQSNMELLGENPYPGRLIVLGMNALNSAAVQVYAVMGRSENSRNRVLESNTSTGNDVVKTQPFDASTMRDPNLVIYTAMHSYGSQDENTTHIATNGAQTDVIRNSMIKATIFSQTPSDVKPYVAEALTTGTYEPHNNTSFEPDTPNNTPRISGFTTVGSKPENDYYGWAITSKEEMTGNPIHRFGGGHLTDIPSGVGLAYHTYEGDGDPLPSFQGSPYPVPILGDTAQDTAEFFWGSLDRDNRVAIAVKHINLLTNINDKHPVDLAIINQLES